MPKIVFDLLCSQPVGVMKFHGGGEYTKTVFQYFIDNLENEEAFDVLVCYNFDKYMDDWVLDKIKINRIKAYDVKNIGDINRLINELDNRDHVRFFTGLGYNYQKENISFPANVTAIGVFHGLRILEKPYDGEAWRYGSYKRRIHEFLDWIIFRRHNLEKEYEREKDALSNFDIVVTVSNHSAYSLRVNYGELCAKKDIRVLYSPMKYVDMSHMDNSSTEQNYIMMVNADRWLKNSYRGIQALDELYLSGLLTVKTRVYGNAPRNIIDSVKSKDYFDFFGYVPGEELERAYKNCDLFFYPTLNEGFGYPPLEAMKYGKTCVISAVASLTEVYGDSVYYFNPYDIMEMKNRILQAADHKIPTRRIEEKVAEIQEKQLWGLKTLRNLILGAQNI